MGSRRTIINVLFKSVLFFIVINILFSSLISPSVLGKLTLYNRLFPGRERFPFGEDQEHAYNLSLYNLDAMFNSLQVAGGQKPVNEFRVFLIGDSSVWGTLLTPEQTLSGQINSMGLTNCDGRLVKAYNLGYPTLSLTKDVMVMNEAKKYQPDLIIWLLTLESLPRENQLKSPIVINNPERLNTIKQKFNLNIENPTSPSTFASILKNTLIGQKRALADLLRLQLYGALWAATGIDQVYPNRYTPAQRDLEVDSHFHSQLPSQLITDDLAFDILRSGMSQNPFTPMLLVNEPIMISKGKNNDIRYNFFYPRWAYDDYRQIMSKLSISNKWNYLDYWDLVTEDQFTNSAIHLSPKGEAVLAERLGEAITNSCKK